MARAYKVTKKSSASAPKANTTMSAPTKLQLLFTIVSRSKTEFYVDLLQNFDINVQMILSANGTADTRIQSLLGLTNSEKAVIISVVRRDKSKLALAALGERFKTVKGGKGIAYTVPMSSTIGVAIYQFLSNTNNGGLI